MRGGTLLLAMVLLAGSLNAAVAQTTCGSAMKQAAVAELMFGRNIGTRLGVTEVKWSRFVEREIIRFPGD